MQQPWRGRDLLLYVLGHVAVDVQVQDGSVPPRGFAVGSLTPRKKNDQRRSSILIRFYRNFNSANQKYQIGSPRSVFETRFSKFPLIFLHAALLKNIIEKIQMYLHIAHGNFMRS